MKNNCVLKSCKHFSNAEIEHLITSSYLDFILKFDLDGRTVDFELPNKTKVSVLNNGVIGFNLDASTHTHNVNGLKNIVLSCGIHGNETAPIEICEQLVLRILNGEIITPHRVLFVFGNIPSMLIADRFVDENLNRLFTRKTQQTEDTASSLERKRANILMKVIDAFFEPSSVNRYHYDLHTAIRPSINEKFAVYPYLHGGSYSHEQLAFLSSCDVNTILLSQSPTTTFSYYSSFYHQAHAFTVELGKVRPFGQNDMNQFVNVEKQLRALLSQNEVSLPSIDKCPLEIYSVNQVINKNHNDFKLHFADNIANFTGFEKGVVLASEKGTEYVAQHDGEAIVFPNANVTIGQRAILTVIPSEI